MSDRETSTEDKHLGSGVKVVIAAVILIVIAFLIYLLTKGTTITTGNPEHKDVVTTSLSCSGSGLTTDIYAELNAISTEQKLVAIFRNDVFHDATFTFTGQYPDHASASDAEAQLHANYNLYAGGVSLDHDIFNAHFGTDGDSMVASSYAEKDEVSAASAPLIMLDIDRDDPDAKIPSSREEWRANYADRGFLCKTQD